MHPIVNTLSRHMHSCDIGRNCQNNVANRIRKIRTEVFIYCYASNHRQEWHAHMMAYEQETEKQCCEYDYYNHMLIIILSQKAGA